MKKFSMIFRSFRIFTILILSATFLQAQVTTAEITGTVVDSSDQVVTGATVTITNSRTGFSRTTTTDATGVFRITELPPDTYDINVEATNFSKSIVKNLELNVGTNRTVKIELKPGEVTAVVEVAAEGALVETTTSDLDQSISTKEILNLPILNRTFAGLSVIAPEARPVGNFDPT